MSGSELVDLTIKQYDYLVHNYRSFLWEACSQSCKPNHVTCTVSPENKQIVAQALRGEEEQNSADDQAKSGNACIYSVDPSRIEAILQAQPGVCERYGRDRIICQNDTGQNTACDPTIFKLSIQDQWDDWNRKLADAISDEFQKHTKGFRGTFGGERVPLKVTVKYYVQGPPAGPTTYMNKTLTYGINVDSYSPIDIPKGNYNLTDAQLKTLGTNFRNRVLQSLYATMASYQSRLKFPEGAQVPNGRYYKAGTFSNDPAKPKLTYDEGITQRY